MKLKLLHSICTKANGGPAGIRCPCCNNFTTVKKAKVLSNRILRRKLKMRLHKQLGELK